MKRDYAYGPKYGFELVCHHCGEDLKAKESYEHEGVFDVWPCECEGLGDYDQPIADRLKDSEYRRNLSDTVNKNLQKQIQEMEAARQVLVFEKNEIEVEKADKEKKIEELLRILKGMQDSEAELKAYVEGLENHMLGKE